MKTVAVSNVTLLGPSPNCCALLLKKQRQQWYWRQQNGGMWWRGNSCGEATATAGSNYSCDGANKRQTTPSLNKCRVLGQWPWQSHLVRGTATTMTPTKWWTLTLGLAHHWTTTTGGNSLAITTSPLPPLHKTISVIDRNFEVPVPVPASATTGDMRTVPPAGFFEHVVCSLPEFWESFYIYVYINIYI